MKGGKKRLWIGAWVVIKFSDIKQFKKFTNPSDYELYFIEFKKNEKTRRYGSKLQLQILSSPKALNG